MMTTIIPLISPSIPALLPQPITSGSLFSRGECSRPRNRSEPAPVRSCLYLRSTWSKMASRASVAEELLRREPRCHTHDVQVRQNASVGCRTNVTGLLLSTIWLNFSTNEGARELALRKGYECVKHRHRFKRHRLGRQFGTAGDGSVACALHSTSNISPARPEFPQNEWR